MMYEEAIERFRKADLKWTDFGCDGSEGCCGCCGGEFLSEDKVEAFIKAELQAQQTAYEKDKAIHLAIQASNYEQEILMLKAN